MMTRLCHCGCGANLDGRDPRAKYATASCRTRAYERRKNSDAPPPLSAAPAAALPPAPAPLPEPLPPGQITRDQAERRKAQAAAEWAEMELERERGKWLPVDDVETELARRNVALRELVLAVDSDALSKLHPSMGLDEVRAWYANRHRAALEAAAAHEEGDSDEG